MSYPITIIQDIGPDEATALRRIGIRTTTGLLEAAKSPSGRRQLAAKTGIDEKRFLVWANTADRMRIKGVGEDYARLMQAAGIDTVRELKHRPAKQLTEAMRDANAKRRLVEFLPSEKAVARWIEHAKKLPVVIRYDVTPDRHEGLLLGPEGAARSSSNIATSTVHSVRGRRSSHDFGGRQEQALDNINTKDQVGRITEYAIRVFGDKNFAREWLATENPALNNRVPIDMAKTKGGAQQVEAVLSHIAYGDYS